MADDRTLIEVPACYLRAGDRLNIDGNWRAVMGVGKAQRARHVQATLAHAGQPVEFHADEMLLVKRAHNDRGGRNAC